MKKNRFMRLASCLLILCLITTCAISTTFAKYVSGDSASDTARVAKWGITVSTSGTLFSTSYGDADNELVANNSGVNVKSSDTTSIVSPGSQNSTGFQIALSGSPEVAYSVSSSSTNVEDINLAEGSYGVMVAQDVKSESVYNALAADLYTESAGTFTKATSYAAGTQYYQLQDKATVAAGGYYPIVWTVENDGEDSSALIDEEKATLAKVMTAINAKLSGITGNTENALAATYTIKWVWAIDTTLNPNSNSAADTILGNLMAGADNVVVKVGEDYKVLTVDVANKQAKIDTTVYANLEVAFDINVVVSQED